MTTTAIEDGDERMRPGKRLGMKISLPGILTRAAERVARTRDEKHLEWPLRELLKHLRELKEHPEKHGEFFELWVF